MPNQSNAPRRPMPTNTDIPITAQRRGQKSGMPDVSPIGRRLAQIALSLMESTMP